MGTQASAITFLSAPGQAYTDGMRFVQYYFGLPLAMIVICIFFVPISADVETKVMAQIDQLMNKDNKPYFNAAMYYMENGKDLNTALGWFDKAVEAQPSAFWIHHQRANCLAKLGKKADAKMAAEKSIELATAAKNDDYVKLNEKLLKELK